MVDGAYICVRQQAGPFVKALSTDRACFVRRSKDSKGAIRKRAGPAMCRTSVDKLELRLALFCYDGVFYTLTFADEHLPKDLDGVQAVWDAFLKRLTRWSKRMGRGGSPDFYVYRIEGLHGDHRYHIHAFLRDSDFPPAVVRYLWDWGEAYDVPYDRKRVVSEQGYRKLAVYFTKEVPEVGRHLNGFHGVDNALCGLGNNLGNQIQQARFENQQCCCETQRLIERGFCDVINAGNQNTQRIIDKMTCNELQTLRDQLQTANFQLSQQAQSANLIATLRPTPIPSYLTCSPYESSMMYAGYGWGRNGNGCGCC